ncbi:hypothetical protein POTOM_010846 [Populus tomentosa]|uniref:Glutaredoxin domain-containing protein n=1 Tax=Populus tomentosa TaxID=118781 RepID=A0A8X8A990_POPTO|nr:hypothetical protein POTOM_010846 [Populus tomentosa]
MDLVNVMIQGKPVVIFRKSSCCMSHSVESLIRGFGANLTVYELDRITNGQQIERALVQLGFRQSLPAVFIGQQLVGNERQVIPIKYGYGLLGYVKNEVPCPVSTIIGERMDLAITSTGRIILPTTILNLNDVLVVPAIKKKLLSVSYLQEIITAIFCFTHEDLFSRT